MSEFGGRWSVRENLSSWPRFQRIVGERDRVGTQDPEPKPPPRRRSAVGAAFLEVPPADGDVPGVAADLDLRALAHSRFCGDRKNMSPIR